MLYGVLGLATLVLVIYCAINCITTPDDKVRNLPKLLWLVLIIFTGLIGSVAWLVAGRPATAGRRLPSPGRAATPADDRPGRAHPTSPDDDEAFLRGLRERAEHQRRDAERQRRDAERQRREQPGDGTGPGSP